MTQEEVESALKRACGHQGIRAPYERSDGYKNGSEMVLFPILNSGGISGIRFNTNIAILVSHRYKKLAASLPMILTAPTSIVDQVVNSTNGKIIPIAIPQHLP